MCGICYSGSSMGIDLQDINNVIHYGAPSSSEDYFQESGMSKQ